VQVPQLSEGRNVDSRLCSHFMPDRLESHPYHGVEILELSIPDVQVFKIEILTSRSASSHLMGFRVGHTSE
jgi:hypothetical protein